MNQEVQAELDAAADVIREGGILLYPTRTLWGIGGDARKPGVIRKLQEIKGRDHKPFLVLVHDLSVLRTLTSNLPAAALKLMAALWPGELTLLLPAVEDLPPALVGPEGFVGIRLATHPVPHTLMERTGAWLISTSANKSGAPSPTKLEDVDTVLMASVDAVIDQPPHPQGVQSTIVSVDAEGVACLVREGAIGRQVISSILGGELHG